MEEFGLRIHHLTPVEPWHVQSASYDLAVKLKATTAKATDGRSHLSNYLIGTTSYNNPPKDRYT